jgi:hypothetical protein
MFISKEIVVFLITLNKSIYFQTRFIYFNEWTFYSVLQVQSIHSLSAIMTSLISFLLEYWFNKLLNSVNLIVVLNEVQSQRLI